MDDFKTLTDSNGNEYVANIGNKESDSKSKGAKAEVAKILRHNNVEYENLRAIRDGYTFKFGVDGVFLDKAKRVMYAVFGKNNFSVSKDPSGYIECTVYAHDFFEKQNKAKKEKQKKGKKAESQYKQLSLFDQAKNELKRFIANNKQEPVDWITVNGAHIPIYEGEYPDEAVKRFVKEEDEKAMKRWKKEMDPHANKPKVKKSVQQKNKKVDKKSKKGSIMKKGSSTKRVLTLLKSVLKDLEKASKKV